jgi:hypothetical protein
VSSVVSSSATWSVGPARLCVSDDGPRGSWRAIMRLADVEHRATFATEHRARCWAEEIAESLISSRIWDVWDLTGGDWTRGVREVGECLTYAEAVKSALLLAQADPGRAYEVRRALVPDGKGGMADLRERAEPGRGDVTESFKVPGVARIDPPAPAITCTEEQLALALFATDEQLHEHLRAVDDDYQLAGLGDTKYDVDFVARAHAAALRQEQALTEEDRLYGRAVPPELAALRRARTQAFVAFRRLGAQR